MDDDRIDARMSSTLDGDAHQPVDDATAVMQGEIHAIQDGASAQMDDEEEQGRVGQENEQGLLSEGDEGGSEQSAVRSKQKKSKRRERQDEGEDAAPASGDEGGPSDLPQLSEQERRRQEMMYKIDMAVKGPKKRPRKKADETDLDEAADDEVARMRDTMAAAAAEDRVANEEGRPATSKLRMLRDAVETLQKTGYQQSILDNNLLEAVRMWLEPLPDKSLPSLNIQRALFPLLDRMYIDSTSLKMSGLGKLVLFYTRCPRVDRSIARIADRLLESWSRPILKRSSSYRDRSQEQREYRQDAMRSMQRAAQSSQAARASAAANQRARIPESITGNAFRFAPRSAASDSLDDSQLARLAEKQRINKFKRSMAASKR